MSPVLVGLICGVVSSSIALRLMNMRWRHRREAVWAGKAMVLEQPGIRRHLAIAIIALFPPLMLMVSLVRGPDSPLTLSMILFGAIVCAFAAWAVWAAGSRSITISPKAIEFHGLWGRRLPWTDIDKIEAFLLPKRSFVIFTGKNGKAIAVDSTLYGWEEFVEKAPKLARRAGPSLHQAIDRVRGTPA